MAPNQSKRPCSFPAPLRRYERTPSGLWVDLPWTPAERSRYEREVLNRLPSIPQVDPS